MQETPTAVAAAGIRKSFGKDEAAIHVIRNLDFSLPEGRFEAVMGPSGSGKSTLLHLVAGLLAPDAGAIRIGAQDLTGMSDRDATVFRRRHVGLIFQDYNLIPTLTAEENIALPLLLDRRRDDGGRVASLMDALGIAARRRHFPAALSGGERQRVAIARALVGKPTVVLADEPTDNLDSPAAQDFCALMKRLNAETGCAILMVTHDPVVAAAAERIHILRDGRFMDSFETQGSPARVAERYLDAMRAE